MNQTCTNFSHSCVWILIMRASNLHKPHPLLRLSPYHAWIKPAQTSPTPASESLSCVHQTCTILAHSCVWILLIRAPNLRKYHPLLRCNPSHACIKPAQTSLTPASESFSYKHQICTNHNHSCVWILLMRASDLQKPHPLLRLNPSHTCIKHAQTSPTPVSESFSYTHQTCTNLTHSRIWILLIQASNPHKPRPLLRLNHSHKASNLHKPQPLLRLNPSHACIKRTQTSPTPASESLMCEH